MSKRTKIIIIVAIILLIIGISIFVYMKNKNVAKTNTGIPSGNPIITTPPTAANTDFSKGNAGSGKATPATAGSGKGTPAANAGTGKGTT